MSWLILLFLAALLRVAVTLADVAYFVAKPRNCLEAMKSAATALAWLAIACWLLSFIWPEVSSYGMD